MPKGVEHNKRGDGAYKDVVGATFSDAERR